MNACSTETLMATNKLDTDLLAALIKIIDSQSCTIILQMVDTTRWNLYSVFDIDFE